MNFTGTEYGQVSKLLELALASPAIHINDLVMISDVVNVIDGGRKKSCIIKPGSNEIAAIEASLKTILRNY